MTIYPCDKVANKKKKSYEMWTFEGKAIIIEQGQINYHIDTSRGQNGSAVWYNDGENFYVVGMHENGSHSINSATLISHQIYEQIIKNCIKKHFDYCMRFDSFMEMEIPVKQLEIGDWFGKECIIFEFSKKLENSKSLLFIMEALTMDHIEINIQGF